MDAQERNGTSAQKQCGERKTWPTRGGSGVSPDICGCVWSHALIQCWKHEKPCACFKSKCAILPAKAKKTLAYNLERNSLTVVKGKQGLWIYQTFEVHCIITIFARMPFILNILIYVSEILGAFYIWPKRQHMHLVSSVASQFILKLPALLIIAQFWSVQIWIFIMQFWQGMPQFVIGMGCFLFSFYVYWHI